jgi:hypothetical protein
MSWPHWGERASSQAFDPIGVTNMRSALPVVLLLAVMATSLSVAVAVAEPSAELWAVDTTGVCRDDDDQYPRWSEYSWDLSQCEAACADSASCQGFAMDSTRTYCQLFGPDGVHPASRPGTKITRGSASQPQYACYLKRSVALADPSARLWAIDTSGVCRDDGDQYPRWSDQSWNLSQCKAACAGNSNCQGFAMHDTTTYCQLFGSDGAYPASLPGTRITRGSSSQPEYTCYLKPLAVPCTVCDDPADDGNVAWCVPEDCIPGAPPQSTSPADDGYCPAMVGRIDAGSYTNCAAITETPLSDGVKYWASQCDEGLVALTQTSDCAYLIPNRASGALDKVGELGTAGLDQLFGPTSMAYLVPGTTDFWYQFFEKGVAINNAEGSAAYLIAQSASQPTKAKWKGLLFQNKVDELKLFPTQSLAGSGSGNERLALFAGTETPPSAAIIGLSDWPAEKHHLITGEILQKYEDYDAALVNPDRSAGFLGYPIGDRACGDSTCAWEYQSFQNGLITTDGTTASIFASRPQACKVCDDLVEGRSDDDCQDKGNATECRALAGCDWDAKAEVCHGEAQNWCSPNPGDLLCPAILTRAKCDSKTACKWNAAGDGCWAKVYTGGIGERIKEKGWRQRACGGVKEDDSTRDFFKDCTIDGVTHRVWWGRETQCAYVVWGGTDGKSMIRRRYEQPLPAWANDTPFQRGAHVSNQGKTYRARKFGRSAVSGVGPVSVDPAEIIVDGTIEWEYVRPGTTARAVIGVPTSEAREVGSGNWVQFFENGVITYKSGDSAAYLLGDRSVEGMTLKARFREYVESGDLLASGDFPAGDMQVHGPEQFYYVELGSAANKPALLGSVYGGHYMEAEYFDLLLSNDGEAPVAELTDTGSFRYQVSPNGVITDLRGSPEWIPYATSNSFHVKDDMHGDELQPFCFNASRNAREIAMELRRESLGWSDWNAPETSYTGASYTTYYRSTPEGVIYLAEDVDQYHDCAFDLTGKLLTKWQSLSVAEKDKLGHLTSSVYEVQDDNGSYVGEYVYTRYGVLVYKAGDADAYTLGSRAGSSEDGYGLKTLFRKKANQGVIHSGGYFPTKDAYAGTSSSCAADNCWIAELDGHPTEDPDGIRFYSIHYAQCGSITTREACEPTENFQGADYFCLWDDSLDQCTNGAFEVRGDFMTAYKSPPLHGGAYDDSALGIPFSNVVCTDADCGVRYQNFDGGSLTDTTGTILENDQVMNLCRDDCGSVTSDCSLYSCRSDSLSLSTCGNEQLCASTCGGCPIDPYGEVEGWEWNRWSCYDDNKPVSCLEYRQRSSNDLDADGLDDSFELDLATKFAPDLEIENRSFHRLYGAGDGPSFVCPSSDPYCRIPFVVRGYKNDGSDWLDCRPDNPSEPKCLEIHYAMLYNWDSGKTACDQLGGWTEAFHVGSLLRFTCQLAGVELLYSNSHRGDGEHIGLLVARESPHPYWGTWSTSWSSAKSSAGKWRVIKRITSAHRCAGPWESTKMSRFVKRNRDSGTPLGADQHQHSPMVVYVAEYKNASYQSDGACDRGAMGVDDCDGDGRRRKFPTAALMNAGEAGPRSNGAKVNYPGRCAWCRAGGSQGKGYVWEHFGRESTQTGHLFHVWRNMGPGHTDWSKESWECGH